MVYGRRKAQNSSETRKLANVVDPKVNSEIWNGNYFSSHIMTDINLKKLELLILKTAYATTITCEKVIERLGQHKQDLRKEVLSP